MKFRGRGKRRRRRRRSFEIEISVSPRIFPSLAIAGPLYDKIRRNNNFLENLKREEENGKLIIKINYL